MIEIQNPYKKLVLVCTNCREEKKCCAGGGSELIRDTLKTRVKELGLPVRVSKSGCLDRCSLGPTVVIMPDNIWFGEVGLDDVESILNLLQKSL